MMTLKKINRVFADVMRKITPRFDLAPNAVSLITISDTRTIVTIDDVEVEETGMCTAITVDTDQSIDIKNAATIKELFQFICDNAPEEFYPEPLMRIINKIDEAPRIKDLGDVIKFYMTSGEEWHVPVNSIDWESNARKLSGIKEVASQLKVMASALIHGDVTPEVAMTEVNDALGSLNITLDFSAFKLTKREEAILRIFDCYYVYETVINMTLEYIATRDDDIEEEDEDVITTEEELDSYADDEEMEE